jgi:hypothetical protein
LHILDLWLPPEGAILRSLPAGRVLWSGWTLAIVDVLCAVAATLLCRATLDHFHAISNDCGALAKMPERNHVAFLLLLTLCAATVIIAIAAPLRRSVSGQAAKPDIAIDLLLRMALAGGAALYVFLMFRAGASYRVPCGGWPAQEGAPYVSPQDGSSGLPSVFAGERLPDRLPGRSRISRAQRFPK